MAVIDASHAAQNARVAEESLGLGTCYVGAARNRSRDLSSLLGLSERVIALFRLAVGQPGLGGSPAAVKPRLAESEMVRRETWRKSSDIERKEQASNLTAYNEARIKFI
ncbi:hypothetical protein K445DRAFT_323260 [Daldinia sp. EC12]|nr:hypothetical protein K445DRAFT_323260 [Daldinia sp. EC12]